MLPSDSGESSTIAQFNLPENGQLWGYWTVKVASDHKSIEIVPARSMQLHLNAVRLLETTPCKTCLQVRNVKAIGPNEIQADHT